MRALSLLAASTLAAAKSCGQDGEEACPVKDNVMLQVRGAAVVRAEDPSGLRGPPLASWGSRFSTLNVRVGASSEDTHCKTMYPRLHCYANAADPALRSSGGDNSTASAWRVTINDADSNLCVHHPGGWEGELQFKCFRKKSYRDYGLREPAEDVETLVPVKIMVGSLTGGSSHKCADGPAEVRCLESAASPEERLNTDSGDHSGSWRVTVSLQNKVCVRRHDANRQHRGWDVPLALQCYLPAGSTVPEEFALDYEPPAEVDDPNDRRGPPPPEWFGRVPPIPISMNFPPSTEDRLCKKYYSLLRCFPNAADPDQRLNGNPEDVDVNDEWSVYIRDSDSNVCVNHVGGWTESLRFKCYIKGAYSAIGLRPPPDAANPGVPVRVTIGPSPVWQNKCVAGPPDVKCFHEAATPENRLNTDSNARDLLDFWDITVGEDGDVCARREPEEGQRRYNWEMNLAVKCYLPAGSAVPAGFELEPEQGMETEGMESETTESDETAPAGPVRPCGSNVAQNKMVTCAPSGFKQCTNPQTVTDGAISDPSHLSPRGPSNTCADRLYVTIDLGQPTMINQVTLVAYANREYCGRRVDVSTDASTWTTVTDLGEAYRPFYSTHTEMDFETVETRYIRVWSSRSNANRGTHFVEVQATCVGQGCC